MNGCWLATMETLRYSWRAVGKTKEEAIDAVVHEWNHGKGSEHRESMTEEELREWYGLYAEFMEFGQCDWY